MDVDPLALAELRASLRGEELDLTDQLVLAMKRANVFGPKLLNVEKARAQFNAIGQRPRGFFPDGSLVPESFKRAVHDQYRARQDEIRDEIYGRPGRPAVMASADWDMPPCTAYVFGLG